MQDQVIKCPICGEPYIVMAFTAANQSACPKCVAKAQHNSGCGRGGA